MAHDVIHSGTHGDDTRSTAKPINAVLRDARQRLGVDLRDVADTLRIRYVFLQAIEDGRYGDLPGTAYASGFVRSYAEFLQLDADAVLRRFKEEAAASPPRMEIYLPTPVPEGRVPGGALLLSALVVAGVVYGVWYYLSATDRSIADFVPALPERLVALLDTRSLPDPTAVPARPSAPAPAAPSPSPAAAPSPTPAPSASAAPTPPVPTPPASVSASLSPLPVAPGTKPPAPPPAAATAANAPAGGDDGDDETEAQDPTPLAGSAPSVPTVAAAAEPPADLGPPKRTFGSQNASAHVQIRATQDSWLQIRDGNSELFSRVMKPGDVYRVPDNKTGLKLRTGNGGGLIPIVGGVPGAPLGSTGQVMRDVSVDGLAAKQPH